MGFWGLRFATEQVLILTLLSSIQSVFLFICKMFSCTFFSRVCKILGILQVSESVREVVLFVSTLLI